jgi:hypothetical protein
VAIRFRRRCDWNEVLVSRFRRLVLFVHDVDGAVKSEEGSSMGAAVGVVKLGGGGNGCIIG